MSFSEQYKDYFSSVCVTLGQGWKVEQRGVNNYMITLFNHNLKNYSINIRLDKGRFSISDHIKKPFISYKKGNHCAASVKRKPESVANDIKKKIIFNAIERIEEAKNNHLEALERKETEEIIKGLAGRLVNTSRHYSKMFSFQHKSSQVSGSIDGFVKQDRYRIEVGNLNQEQLIKLIAAISEI